MAFPEIRGMRRRLAALMVLVTTAVQAGPVFTGGWFGQGPAIRGYDTVAYHTEGAAIRGLPEHAARYDGVDWHFATAANRDMFLASPARYLPAYGGYCAYAMGAKDKRVKVDPEMFTIVAGRLFLNYSDSVRDDWLRDRDALIRAADQNWPHHQDQ